VRHDDLQGLREAKYEWLRTHDVLNTKWNDIEPASPSYFFIPRDTTHQIEYETFWKITDAMPVNSTGVLTARDHFSIDFESDPLKKRVTKFLDSAISDSDIKDELKLSENYAWRVSNARRELIKTRNWEGQIREILYRPFDIRKIIYNPAVVWRVRSEVMQHMLNSENLALITSRMTKGEDFKHAQVSDKLVEVICMSPKTSNNGFVFPLYLYPTAKTSLFEDSLNSAPDGRCPNIDPEFIAVFSRITGAIWVFDGQGNVAAASSEGEGEKKAEGIEITFGPEDIFYYAYAVFYSPGYRSRYAQFLKTDFPRLPITSQRPLFAKLITLGKSLVELHLMRRHAPSVCSYPIAGDNKVEKVSFEADSPNAEFGKVSINTTQYFANVPRAVWTYQIGGYQVAHKWLKDRKGRLLTFAELQHYSQVLAALASTTTLQTEIDAVIDAAGGWPIL